MIFVRTGPRFLFLYSNHEENLRNMLVESLKGEIMSLNSAMENAAESSTIIFLMTSQKERADMKGEEVVLLPYGSSVTLCTLFNENMRSYIDKVELGPGMLLQRIPKGGQNVIENLSKYYDGKGMDLIEALEYGGPDDTVIVFTDRPLNKRVKVDEVLTPVLLVNLRVPEMYRNLRQEAVRYYTEGLETGQWHEVHINIYDAAEEYDINYQRLVQALDDLEIGLILGEMWTRDHAFALFAVVVYQVKLFITVDPLELKKVLMGLEYDDKGDRIVDFDLYHHRKKIEKADITRKLPKDIKNPYKHLREELFSKLSYKSQQEILRLEKEL